MLTLTRKTDYALVALATLADRRADEHHPLSARRIARQYDMPLQVLVKVLKDLQRAGIIGSTRGAYGGYYLQREPGAISLADVTEALEGRVRLTPCCDEDDRERCTSCGITLRCPISVRVKALNDNILHLFRQVMLSDLLQDTVKTKLSGLSLSATRPVEGSL